MSFSVYDKKREGKIEVERNDGLRVPWGGQKSDQLSDERWAGTAGHSDMGSDPRTQLAEDCMHAKLLQLCPTLCDPMDGSPPGSSVHGNSPGKNTGLGCHALLQGISPTQGMNPDLPQCRRILCHPSHQESLEIAYKSLPKPYIYPVISAVFLTHPYAQISVLHIWWIFSDNFWSLRPTRRISNYHSLFYLVFQQWAHQQGS